jgi:hypothetical protein
MDYSAETNDADRDGIDLGVDGDTQGTRARPHDWRRTSHLVARIGVDLDHKLAFGELAHQRGNRRPVEAGLARQLRPGDSGRAVHQTQQHRQVVTANGIVTVAQTTRLGCGRGVRHAHQRPPGILRVRISSVSQRPLVLMVRSRLS